MNILNLILHDGHFYYFCGKFSDQRTEFSGTKMCTLCRIPMIFPDFEKKLYYSENSFKFLKCYHGRLLPYLIKIFSLNKESIDCYIKDNFV